MESPATGETTRIAARNSMIESFRGCGLAGIRVDKEELRRTLLMPQYLRLAMRDSIRLKDPTAGAARLNERDGEVNNMEAPQAPMVVFINPRSGGRHGPMLKERLQQLIAEEQVFDLLDVKPSEFVRYGLKCLEMLAALGDSCAREARERMRVMVAGGDGTVGWVLGSLGELKKQGREPFPPVGIIPLGTGNDLSRSFGWGGSFPFAWKSAVKRSLQKASTGQICHLDSWHIRLSMPTGKVVDPPHSLKLTEECALDEGLEVERQLPEKATCYEGVFYNYFSIGMDAQVAYGFHHLRNEKPYLAQGPITNKLHSRLVLHTVRQQSKFKVNYPDYGEIISPYCGVKRGLKNILRMHVKKVNCSEWEQIPVPSSVRAIVALNLHNYGSGRNPWGNLKPEYLDKRGFVEPHVDDGLLEIFGLKQGWHASFVMVELISAKHIAQAAAIRLEIRGGEWKDVYLQMDGEPWKQPLNKDYSTFVDIKKVPFQSIMVNGQ